MGEKGKLHIGNLPYNVTEDDIRDMFERYGDVNDVNIIMDRDTGRAKGFAFVTFENDNDAKDAIDALDESELGGRNIKVNKARPRGDGGGGGGGGYRGGGGGGGRDGYRGGGGGGGRDSYRGGRGRGRDQRDRYDDGGGGGGGRRY